MRTANSIVVRVRHDAPTQASPIAPSPALTRAATSPAAPPTTMRLTFVSTGLNEWIAKLQRLCITKEYVSAAWLAETLIPLLQDAIELLTRGAATSSKASNLVHDMDFTCTYVVNTATEGEMIRRSDVRAVVLQQMRCALQELHRTYPEQVPKSSSSSFTNLMHTIKQPRCVCHVDVCTCVVTQMTDFIIVNQHSYKSLEARPSSNKLFTRQRLNAVLAAIMPCLFAPPRGAVRLC